MSLSKINLYFIALVPRSLKSKFLQPYILSGGSREDSMLRLFLLLLATSAFFGLWQHHSSLLSLSHCIFICASLIEAFISVFSSRMIWFWDPQFIYNYKFCFYQKCNIHRFWGFELGHIFGVGEGVQLNPLHYLFFG